MEGRRPVSAELLSWRAKSPVRSRRFTGPASASVSPNACLCETHSTFRLIAWSIPIQAAI